MAADLACDKFWVNKSLYHDAEKRYYENLAKLRKNGQDCTQHSGEKKEDAHNKKIKENKKLQLKNQKNLNNLLDVEVLRNELLTLEAENAKNENLNPKLNSEKVDTFEIIKKSDENTYIKNNGSLDFEKKAKQKEIKEKKSKNEKKAKKAKNKEENLMGGVGMAKLNQDTFPKTSLAGEVAKARQHIKTSLECMDQSMNGVGGMSNARIASVLERIGKEMEKLAKRVEALEKKCSGTAPAVCQVKCQTEGAKAPTPAKPAKPAKDDDDDVDLFGSESEEEDEEAKKIREQRLAEYAAKKSKKPALVAKSNIILDIKPWDDETDMKEMEKAVRAINMDGLVWGASKLVPVAFKIFKLQISCVIEDDKVSVDVLTETLEAIEDYVSTNVKINPAEGKLHHRDNK